MKAIPAILILICLFKFSAGQVINSNTIFEASKGIWKCPVNSGYVVDKSSCLDCQPAPGINILCDSFSAVHAVFDGTIVLVNEYDSIFMIVVKYGDYFIGYSNLLESCVKKGDKINTGDLIAYTAKDLDGVYAVDIQLSNYGKDIDPTNWFSNIILKRFSR